MLVALDSGGPELIARIGTFALANSCLESWFGESRSSAMVAAGSAVFAWDSTQWRMDGSEVGEKARERSAK